VSITFDISPGGALHGTLRIPGDKSVSHRSVMLGALADGVTEVDGFLEGADSLATLAVFEAMGITVEHPDPGRLIIHGRGLDGLKAPAKPLDLGNSGTSMRLLSGLLAGQRFATTLIGDASLSGRPMRRVTEPLARMGARIDTTEEGTAPLRIHGGQPLHGIDYLLPVASAQIKSALLLAGLYASGTTRITEPAPTRDHTERMLGALGADVERDGATVLLNGRPTLRGTALTVPSDISSAAFFLVGASIAPGSDLHLPGVGINPTRTGVIDILRAMGASIELENPRTQGGEPVADLHVQSRPLHGIDIPEALVPLAIDEFPALFVAAACAEGTTTLRGAAELRVKESDRIGVMAAGLSNLGIDAQPAPDGMVICGGQMTAGRVDSHGDHRVAMAFAIAALRAGGPITVDNCANVDTSFPGFAANAATCGLRITVTS